MSFNSDRQRSRAALEAQGRRLEDDLGEALAAFAIAEQPPEFITEHPLPGAFRSICPRSAPSLRPSLRRLQV
jgi:hypothetical protein